MDRIKLPISTKSYIKNHFQQWLLSLVVLLGFFWRMAIWHIQPGAYLDDEIGHFIIARDAWMHPELIFSWWGRVGCTLFYMPGSLLNWECARWTSLIASQVTVLLTYAVAKRLDLKYPILAIILLELQPWFAASSHELLTEIPALVLMILVVWLALKHLDTSAAFLVGYLPLVRHEYAALVALWGLYTITGPRKWNTLVLVIPIALYNFVTKAYLGVWPLRHLYHPQGTTLYGSGALDHYLRLISENSFVGFPILILAAAGIYWIVGTKPRLLIFTWAASYLIIHTIIYWMGAFSSGGFAIFLLPLAPFFAIAASAGVQNITIKQHDRSYDWLEKLLSFSLAVMLLLGSFYVALGAYKPRNFNGDAVNMRSAAQYLQKHKLSARNIATTNVWLYYWLPLTTPYQNGRWEKVLWIANRMQELKEGDLLVWDNHYSNRFGHNLETLLNSSNWKTIYLADYKGQPIWAIFEKE